MRESLLRMFSESSRQAFTRELNVAIVGGSVADPEAIAAQPLSKSISVLGIEDCDVLYDLNSSQHSYSSKFDLVLCSQVLEHVWRPEKALKNLANLLAHEGLIWISCPASNFPHGSPGYFAAGYTDSFLTSNLSRLGLDIIASGQISSRRNYLARHRFNLWLSESETRVPLMFIRSGSFLESLNRAWKHGFQLLYLTLIREKQDPIWAVESWVMAKRSGSRLELQDA